MSKRILFVANTSWSIYKFRKGLIERLIADGHEVYLLSPEDEHVQDLKDLGAHYVALKQMDAKGISPKADYGCYKELKKMYKNINPDLIFQYTIKPNIYGTLAAKKLGIKTVAVITGLGFTFINKGIVPAIARMMYKYALKGATKVWFLNEDDKMLFSKLKLVEDGKADLLNGEGIDCDYFKPATQEPSLPTEFLFIGRLLYDKGIQEYYEASKRLKKEYPEIRCSVLGYLHVKNPKAVDPKLFQQWVDEGTIHYYGSSQDVRGFAQACSCIVLPSYREGLSMVLLEGASMAKPLIASDIAGCKEVIEHGITGYLARVKDSEDLYSQMKRFHLLNEEAKHKMGQAARHKMIKEFSMDKIYDVYKKEIDNL